MHPTFEFRTSEVLRLGQKPIINKNYTWCIRPSSHYAASWEPSSQARVRTRSVVEVDIHHCETRTLWLWLRPGCQRHQELEIKRFYVNHGHGRPQGGGGVGGNGGACACPLDLKSLFWVFFKILGVLFRFFMLYSTISLENPENV